MSSRGPENVERAIAWPGNVRELEHTIERIMILEDGEPSSSRSICPASFPSARGSFRSSPRRSTRLEDLEKRYIQFILRRTKGRRQDAARILGINRKTLGHKIEKYHLKLDW